MTDKFVEEMIAILTDRDITPERIEYALREFHKKHSYNKHVVISYFSDAMNIIVGKASRNFYKKGVNENGA